MNRKRRKVLISFLLIVFVMGCLAWAVVDQFATALTKVPSPNSRIYLERRHRFSGSVEITDPTDIAFLMRLFGRRYVAQFDTPSCPFDIVRISFVHRGRKVDFYPAADDCELVRYGRTKKIFVITQEEKRALKKLVQQYEKTRKKEG